MQDWTRKETCIRLRFFKLRKGENRTHSDKDTEEGTEQRTNKSDQPVENRDGTTSGREI